MVSRENTSDHWVGCQFGKFLSFLYNFKPKQSNKAQQWIHKNIQNQFHLEINVVQNLSVRLAEQLVYLPMAIEQPRKYGTRFTFIIIFFLVTTFYI